MDIEWLKGMLGVVAQHGPWAVLAFFLTWRVIKSSEAQTEAMVKVAEALTALRVHIEISLPRRDRND